MTGFTVTFTLTPPFPALSIATFIHILRASGFLTDVRSHPTHIHCPSGPTVMGLLSWSLFQAVMGTITVITSSYMEGEGMSTVLV